MVFHRKLLQWLDNSDITCVNWCEDKHGSWTIAITDPAAFSKLYNNTDEELLWHRSLNKLGFKVVREKNLKKRGLCDGRHYERKDVSRCSETLQKPGVHSGKRTARCDGESTLTKKQKKVHIPDDDATSSEDGAMSDDQAEVAEQLLYMHHSKACQNSRPHEEQ